jgi:hypothetical protein
MTLPHLPHSFFRPLRHCGRMAENSDWHGHCYAPASRALSNPLLEENRGLCVPARVSVGARACAYAQPAAEDRNRPRDGKSLAAGE